MIVTCNYTVILFSASRYDMRMSHNREELLDNFENGTVVDTTDLIPLPAGTMEIFNFTPQNITIKNGTVLYFVLVAIDKVNQMSEPSNLAKALLFIPPDPKSNSKSDAMVLLILLAVFFATGVVVLTVYYLVRKKRPY